MPNSKQYTISNTQFSNKFMTGNKTYDLEERTFEFAREVRLFVKTLPSNNCKY